MSLSRDEWASAGDPKPPFESSRKPIAPTTKDGRPPLKSVPRPEPDPEDDVVECDVADALLEEGATITVKVTSYSRMLPAPPKFPMKYPRVEFTCVDVDSGEIFHAHADLLPKLRPTHKFYRWWAMALGHKPKRADRPPRLSIFVDKTFKARVSTVKRSWAGASLPAEQLHSVVHFEALVERVELAA